MHQSSAGQQARGRQEAIREVPQAQPPSSSKPAWQFSYSSLDVIYNISASTKAQTSILQMMLRNFADFWTQVGYLSNWEAWSPDQDKSRARLVFFRSFVP